MEKSKFFTINSIGVAFILSIYISLNSCEGGPPYDFNDDTKMAVQGKIVNKNGIPIANYPVQIYSSDYYTTNDDYTFITSFGNSVFVNNMVTDANGNFTIFFPDTSWQEFLKGKDGDSLIFNFNNRLIKSPYRILKFTNNYENVGTLKINVN